MKIMQAKKNGTAITVETKVPIVGYLCDTTTEALRLPTQAALIANCPVYESNQKTKIKQMTSKCLVVPVSESAEWHLMSSQG